MSQSTRITLICHGSTETTKSAGFPADEPLIDGEITTAQRIRQILPYAHSFLSGPELRARQTAAALADRVSVDTAFRDINYGRWAGRTLAVVQESEVEGLMAWISDIEASPHGGESIASVIARIGDWLTAEIGAGGHRVIVTHPAVIRAALVAVLDAPKQSFWKIDVRPLGMTEITSDGRRWALRSFGREAG